MAFKLKHNLILGKSIHTLDGAPRENLTFASELDRILTQRQLIVPDLPKFTYPDDIE